MTLLSRLARSQMARPVPVPMQVGWTRLLTTLRASNTGLLALSLLVGAGAGGGAILFRWLIQQFTLLLSGHADYSIAGHAANPHVPGLGRWFVLIAPVVAGLVYGPVVHLFAREARGHGVPEVMYAVARRGGRIAPQVAAVKALASALCIGGGGSVGREGPIVQIGSALGSTLGSVLRVAESRMRVLVACGAAGGIAATFNAPLAGVFFAMELILRDFAAQSFGMVVLSSVTASVIGRSVFGNRPFLHLPAFTVAHPVEYALFAALGLISGVVGVLFTRVLYLVEDGCDAAWRGPEWARPAVGGLALGGVLLVLPQMYGVGYPVLSLGVAGHYTIAFLIALVGGKILATSLTIGIGGSGGVFAPSLFIGAMAGAAYGQVLHHLAPGLSGPTGAYALIGMGAVFAGAARAPITAVIIMFELTGDYAIILPLMAAIVLAAGVSHLLSADTIYTLKLRRRGVNIDQHDTSAALGATSVEDVMRPAGGTALTERTPLTEAAAALGRTSIGQLPVTDGRGCYCGVVTARAVADALAAPGHEDAAVSSLVEYPPTVTADQSVEHTLDALAAADGPVPVTDHDRTRLLGWLTHQQVLRALQRPGGRSAASMRSR